MAVYITNNFSLQGIRTQNGQKVQIIFDLFAESYKNQPLRAENKFSARARVCAARVSPCTPVTRY